MLNQGWNPDDFTLACVLDCGATGRESACQFRRHKRCEFSLWRRKQQPTPVFLTGKSHGQRSLGTATVHRVAKSCTRLERLGTYTHREGMGRSRIQEGTWRFIQPTFVCKYPPSTAQARHCSRHQGYSRTNRDSLDPFDGVFILLVDEGGDHWRNRFWRMNWEDLQEMYAYLRLEIYTLPCIKGDL